MSYKYFWITLNVTTRDHFYKKFNEKKNSKYRTNLLNIEYAINLYYSPVTTNLSDIKHLLP